jgi:hypothetical protein
MGNGVTGSGSAPANQTTNAGHSGAPSPADTPAQSKFDQTLEKENICPPGLGRPPHVGSFPPRYDPPCTYLRKEPVKIPLPSQVPDPNPGGVKGPTNGSNGTDYSKPIPQSPSTSLPKLPEDKGPVIKLDERYIGWKFPF